MGKSYQHVDNFTSVLKAESTLILFTWHGHSVTVVISRINNRGRESDRLHKLTAFSGEPDSLNCGLLHNYKMCLLLTQKISWRQSSILTACCDDAITTLNCEASEVVSMLQFSCYWNSNWNIRGLWFWTAIQCFTCSLCLMFFIRLCFARPLFVVASLLIVAHLFVHP